MNYTTDTKVSEYQGYEIKLDSEKGKFYTVRDGRRSESESLKGLQRRIDELERAKSRTEALPVLILTEHYRDENPDVMTVGTFAGTNAHTREIRILVKDGTERAFSEGAWLYRPDTDLTEIQQAQRDIAAAKAALAAARDRKQELQQKYGYRVHFGYSSGNKREAAAQAEAGLVAYLKGEEPKT